MKTADVRADLPLLEDIIYLDAASTTPTPIPVIEAMYDFFCHFNANTGRGAYKTAVKSTAEFENARFKIAKFIDSLEEEVIFTKNTTEAINLVANGINFKNGDKIIVPNIEHHSNLVPWINLQKKGVRLQIIRADEYGVIDPLDVENAIDENTKFITTTHVSNTIGSVQPVYEIGEIAAENDIYYMVDAAQSVGHMEIDLKRMKADFMAVPGHKGLLGPVGTGFLYCSSEAADHIEPMNLGGGTVSNVTEEKFQLEKTPTRFEGGTQNIAGVIGLGAAIDYIKRIGIDKIEKHSRKLTRYMLKELNSVEDTKCYGNPENIYAIVGFNINNINSHDVAKILDEVKNICVRSGYHCATPAIRHIGAYDLGGTVRASLHYYNTKEEVQMMAEILGDISKFLGD